MPSGKYDDLTKEELTRLLEARERRTRFGLVWEANEIERDKALNSDFVALDLVPELSCPRDAKAWRYRFESLLAIATLERKVGILVGAKTV